jgi:starch phosphorylase
MRAIGRFTVRTALPDALTGLGELSLNLRWSWHQPTKDLFASIDPGQWLAVGEDPIRLLGAVPQARLAELASDPAFLARLEGLGDDLRRYRTAPAWYQTHHADGPASIAYFSPEFGVAETLPQYSGGLGILAGDHLKAASDLGVPLVGVGLLYRLGYFRQSLSAEGWQLERYPLLDPVELPLSLLRHADGTAARVAVGLPGGRQIAAQIWVAQVGRVPLLMLDSNIAENDPAEREVTDRLYGGGQEHRLHQEMLLGIGGVRALRVWAGISGEQAPTVYHSNEGHAGFLGLERIRELVENEGFPLDAALESVRAGTVFTTHTPVPAGIDRFPMDAMAAHFGGDNACPGLPVERVLALGREDYPGGDPGVFNMAVMGLRLAQRSNGVSLLHGEVSRGMFNSVWPGIDQAEVPISSITNGVHTGSWVAPELLALAHPSADGSLVEGLSPEDADSVAGDLLWALKRVLRERLVLDARRRLRESWRTRGATEAELRWVDGALDPDVLTIGFARRVPSYKRLTLMMRDPDRLRALLLHPERPIQIVIAGKSHPADDGGKRLIQEIVRFSDDPRIRHRIVFLPDYDIGMARPLYPGCDVWLNNPLRPLEACGTSGMKAALNGGLNLSILDGWWDEWYDGTNGWAIPSADGVVDHDRRDDLEANALYDLLENTVTPAFYTLGADGLPSRWLELVRNVFRSLGPKVPASRMVRDYVQRVYLPAAVTAAGVAGAPAAGELAAWKSTVRAAWPQVAISAVESELSGAGDGSSPSVGDSLTVGADVRLDSLEPADVRVEIVFGRTDDADILHDARRAVLTAGASAGGVTHYRGSIPLERPGGFGYTVRVVPEHAGLVSPVELGLVHVPTESAAFG